MKKMLIALVVLVALGVAYYAISPLFDTNTLDEAPPEALQDSEGDEAVLQNERARMPSGAERLSEEERAQMEEQIAEANETDMPPMEEPMPPQESTVSGLGQERFEVMGTIGHPASGSVRIIDAAEGPVVRFENLDTINGPNIHVYLAKDLEAEDFVDLGPLKATNGNINYPVPEGVDVSKYRYVMHWCVPFGVLFNYAEIM